MCKIQILCSYALILALLNTVARTLTYCCTHCIRKHRNKTQINFATKTQINFAI